MMATRGGRDRSRRFQHMNNGCGDRLSSGNVNSRRSADSYEKVVTNKIFVSNFPAHFKDADLHKIFAKYGQIEEINIVQNDNEKKFGFVTFSTVEEATEAKNEAYGTGPYRLFVNYARVREDYVNMKNSRDNQDQGNYKLRQRSRSLGPVRNVRSTDNHCVSCGDLAEGKCAYCGAKYCSTKCQADDWQNHALICLKRPDFITLNSSENITDKSQDENVFKQSKLLQPRERFLANQSANLNKPREPSVGEIVREITTDYKKTNMISSQNTNVLHKNRLQNDDTMKDALRNKINEIYYNPKPKNENENLIQHANNKPLQDNQSTEHKMFDKKNNSINAETETKEQNILNNRMYLLIEQLKKSKVPNKKKPWEEFEPLPKDKFSQICVQSVSGDTFAGFLVEKESIALNMLSKANDDALELEPLSDIKPGDLCFAYEDNLRWRSKVLSTSPCTVRLLDSGLVKIMEEGDLYKVSSYFEDVPAQAILMRFKPGKNCAVNKYQYLSVKPTGEFIDDAQVVELEEDSNKNSICKNELIDVSQKNNRYEKTSVVIRDNIHRESEDLSSEFEQIWKKTVSLPNTYTKVRVITIDGADVYVNMLSKMKDVVIPLLSNANHSAKVPVANVVLGMLCLAQFEGIRYRAVIRSMNPIKAFLLDYGNLVTLTEKEVFVANDVQSCSPGQAIRVRLEPESKIVPKVEVNFMMKTINKIGDVHIVQADVIDSEDEETCVSKDKKHAIEYMEMYMKGYIIINDRPCSNKFCLNLNVHNIRSVHKELTKQIEKSAADKKYIEEPSVGDQVLAEVDGRYLRAKVLHHGETTYVSLTDIGKVISSNKFLVMSKILEEYPSLSFMGTLHSLDCDKDEFEAKLNKEKIGFIVASVNNNQVILKCHFEHDDTFSFVLQLTIWEPEVEQLSHSWFCLEPLTKCQVQLTHFEHYRILFVRKTTPELDKQYEEDLQNVASYGLNAKPLITLPVVNEVVIAKYVDNVFYKAIVKEVDGENVKVFYTAYGNSDIVKLSDIKSISNVLKNVNMFIWKVALADVPDLPLTAPVSSLMNGIINSSPAIEFTMKPCQTTKAQCEVYLMYPEGTSLNEKVAHLLTPLWHDISDMPKEKAEDTLLNQDVFMKGIIKFPEISAGENIELFIVDASNLSMNIFFACHPEKDIIMNMLLDVPKLLREYATSIDIPYNPRVDEVCIAKFAELNGTLVWHRAACLSHEGESCYLTSLDLGIMQYVNIKNIRRMSPDFIGIPRLSAIFSIQGLPEPPLSNEVVNILQEEFKSCEATIKFPEVRRESDGSYSVRLPKELMDSVLSAL